MQDDKKKKRKLNAIVKTKQKEPDIRIWETKKETPAGGLKLVFAPKYSEDEENLIALVFFNVTVDHVVGVGRKKFCSVLKKE